MHISEGQPLHHGQIRCHLKSRWCPPGLLWTSRHCRRYYWTLGGRSSRGGGIATSLMGHGSCSCGEHTHAHTYMHICKSYQVRFAICACSVLVFALALEHCLHQQHRESASWPGMLNAICMYARYLIIQDHKSMIGCPSCCWDQMSERPRNIDLTLSIQLVLALLKITSMPLSRS